jgi:hypothetical protein
MTTTSLFNQIVAALGGELRKDGEYHVECPYCHKESKPHQIHFSYCESGCWCFVCGNRGKGGSLWTLAEHLKLENLPTDYHAPEPPPRKPLPIFGERLLASYAARPERYDRWLAYRGLRSETVDRFRLGYGKLPGEKWAHMQDALILPVFDRAGRCRTLRARNGNGWFTEGGGMLYAPVGVEPGATIIVVENCATCLLIVQASPHLTPLAPTTGASTWDSKWIKRLAQLQPELVIVAGDNDPAGEAMNERWALALEIAGIPVVKETFTEAKEEELMRL